MILMKDWGFYSRLQVPSTISDRELMRACHDKFGPSYRTWTYREERHRVLYKMLNIHHSIQATS